MEENKTIGTAALEELDEEALARATGGCVLMCDYDIVDYRILMFEDETRTYKAYRCKTAVRSTFTERRAAGKNRRTLSKSAGQNMNFSAKRRNKIRLLSLQFPVRMIENRA